MEEDFHESEDMQKLDGEEVWSRKHTGSAGSGGRRRATPGAGAAAAAAAPCPSRSRPWAAPGWAPRPPGARRALPAMRSRGSTGQTRTCRGKRRRRGCGCRCCSGPPAVPAAHGNWCQNCCLLHTGQAREEASPQGSWSH